MTDDPRWLVRDLVRAVRPLDAREAADQAGMLAWITSGAPLFRTQPPATPPIHLAVYATLIDAAGRRILLADHRKARMWLPTGGHVEDGEDPRRAVEREIQEELGITARFHEHAGDRPWFVSVTATRGPDSHTDVGLWFVLRADPDVRLRPDPREIRQVRWFDLNHRPQWRAPCFDPHMHRFIRKLAHLPGIPTGGNPRRTRGRA
jgi:8-oxo-dGTP diphosphatase